jgi:hypothetical protein
MSEFNRRRATSGLDGLKPAFERLTDGVSTLVKQHIELARYEVTQDVTTAGKRIAILGACAMVALLGYVVLLGAAVLFAGWLGGMLAAWITAAAIALIHLAAAAGLGLYYGKKLRDDKPVDLAQIGDEINRDKQWLQQIAAASKDGKTPARLSHEHLRPS